MWRQLPSVLDFHSSHVLLSVLPATFWPGGVGVTVVLHVIEQGWNGGPGPFLSQSLLQILHQPSNAAESAPSLWRDLVAFGRIVILAIIKVLHKVDWQAPIA